MQPVDLIEHPEGGRFREVFRSGMIVKTAMGKSRSAITHIYFSLSKGEASRFHRVSSDEIWNLYAGDGIRIYTWDGTSAPPTCTELSRQSNTFCHVIPAGVWQAAEPRGDSVLVGCSVGPGFEFEDFELINPQSSQAEKLLQIDSKMYPFVVPSP